MYAVVRRKSEIKKIKTFVKRAQEQEDADHGTLLRNKTGWFDYLYFKFLQPQATDSPSKVLVVNQNEQGDLMENLGSVPLRDFLRAHSIYPKVFMLLTDYQGATRAYYRRQLRSRLSSTATQFDLTPA